MLPISDDDLRTIRAKRVQAKLFAHRAMLAGIRVSVRQNLNHRVKKNKETFSIQTVHNGSTPRGRVLGYDGAVTVRNATFFVDQAARASIASGHTKFAMAAVVGELMHCEASLAGVAIRFNPKTTQHFSRVDDGRPVEAADEVTVFNTRAYARGIIKYLDAQGVVKV
jgi:hypothetical protein